MTKVKICGVMTFDDALQAAEFGADMLGLNFFKRSPRYVDPDDARKICDGLRAQLGEQCPVLVGVFVNELVANISTITTKVGLDFAQLSGDESDSMLKELRGIGFKAIQPMNKEMALEDVRYYAPYFPQDERAPSILLDAYHPHLYGGTGEQASVEVALTVKEAVPRMMLAGGLNPDNVAERIQAIHPWGVDVASGVEMPDSPGVKDPARVKRFIEAVRSVG
ncbi:MAG: phosphoribosylanthranilate isomerase [Chloroflexi bacterium]|nr:MAG: phosphoribosylanthranilate isomerase [Chloroflexota bacterium]